VTGFNPIAPRRARAELRSGGLPFSEAFGPRRNHKPEGEASLGRTRYRKGAEPHEGRQSRERPAAFVACKTPGAPPGSGNVGSTSGRKGVRGFGPGSRSKGGGGECLGGANTQEGKVRRLLSSGRSQRSPSRSEPTSGVAAGRGFGPGRRNDRRGEASRGVPLTGRRKALKGEPHGRCGGRRAVAKPGGEKTVERVAKP
jgi:hypothetical protein